MVEIVNLFFPYLRAGDPPEVINNKRVKVGLNGKVRTVTLKVSEGFLRKVDELAWRLGVERSELIRRALAEYLIKYGVKVEDATAVIKVRRVKL